MQQLPGPKCFQNGVGSLGLAQW